MQHRIHWLLLSVVVLTLAGPSRKAEGGDLKIIDDIQARRAQFMPQELTASFVD